MTYYRIQDADRDTTDLLDPEQQWSLSYSTDTERHGISCCDSLDALAAYLCRAGVPFDTTSVVVAMDGRLSDDEGEDAALGEYLIIPTRIISITPMVDELADLIDAECDRIGLC